ncbi:winged helix-turn-helix transcriptional regulator [Lonsdalea quercina]|uniref:winged helix-turn-helix transcriptional regulator n=1 Tax=Lonsdalea quercina TaxID=71657 RepID=UPI00397545C0
MLKQAVDCASTPCPHRLLLDQIADKWSVLILDSLCEKPLRFNVIKRELKGITQKSLTQTLRRLQRNGIISRRIITTSPIAVEYEITPLGRTLKEPIEALCAWTRDYLPQVEAARKAFDEGEGGDNLSVRSA